MMKRVISLMTSLMMMASLIGGSVVPNTAVSAAAEQPVFSLEDTSVLNGVKKTSVPVKVTSTDLAAMIVSLEISSDKDGEEAPVISGVREGQIPSVQTNSDIKAENKRSFLWNSVDGTGKAFENATIAYVDVILPDSAVSGSSYTLTATKTDPSNEAKDEGYVFSENSKLSAKINVVDPVAVKGFITNMNDQDVKAGNVVAVPMTIECPTDIAALVAKFSVDNGATIKGFVTSNTTLNQSLYQSSKSNPGLILWGPKTDGTGESFKTAKTFVTVLVQVPSDAVAGTKYTVSLDKIDTSSADQDYLEPEKYASAVLTVVEDKITDGLSLEIGSANVKAAQKTAKVPVYVSYTTANEGIAAVIAKFQVTNKDNKKAEITSIEAGSAAADGQFQNSVSVPEKALWNTNNAKNKSFAIKENGEKPVLFILNVKLPEDMVVGDEFVVSTINGSLDIVDENQVNLLAAETAGKIVVVDEESITDGYKISMESKNVTASAKTLTVDVPVYLDGAKLNTFTGAFKVSGGATIKSITSKAYGNGITFGKDNANRIIWQGADGNDTEFTTAEAFVVVTVEIPAALAVAGNTFVVSVDGTVDSANADRVTVYPTEPYGTGVITLKATPETPKTDMGMIIGSATAAPGEIVTIPVNVDVKNLRVLDGKFTIADEYKDYASIVSIKNIAKADGATVSESKKNPGGFLWTIDASEMGMDFTYDTDFIELKVKVAENAPSGKINVGFEGEGVTTVGVENAEAVISTLTPGVITVESIVTTSSDVTSVSSDVTTVSSDVTSVSTEESTVSSEVTSVSSEVTSVSTEESTVSSEVTSVSSSTSSSVTQPSIPDVSAIVDYTGKVTEAIGTDVTLVGDGFEVKAEKVSANKGDKKANVKVDLAGFNGADEHFEYASLKFDLPEGFKIVGCETTNSSIMKAASAIKVVDGNIVELSLVNTYDFDATKGFLTLEIEIPETAAAGEYEVKFVALNSSFRKVIATSAADDSIVATTAKISNVTYSDGSITIIPATVVSKKIAEGSFKVTNPTTEFYYSHADKFDLTGLKVTVDVVTTYSDGTTSTVTIDVTDKIALAGNATPATTYTGKAFKYAIGLVFTDAELAAEGVVAGSFDAFIGQMGDITLDHTVDVVDSTVILREAAQNMMKKSMLGEVLDEVKNTLEDGLYESAGATTLEEFMLFLGNVYAADELDVVDSTLVLRFAAASVVADANNEKLDVAAEWTKLFSNK